MPDGIDYATVQNIPSWLKFVKGRGYSFVGRYIDNYTTGKVITPDELQTIREAGLGLALFWETESVRPIGEGVYGDADHPNTITGVNYWDTKYTAYQAGSDDGVTALRQAALVGYPTDRPIYFCCDFDPDFAYSGTQAEKDKRMLYAEWYMRGVAQYVPASRIGVYAGQKIVILCNSKKIASWFWQTSSWSSSCDACTDVYQYGHGASISTVGVDLNATKKSNFDQAIWMPTTKAAAPVTPEDIEEGNVAEVVFSNVLSTGFTWHVTGLQSPFCTRYYKQVRLSLGSNPESGWITSVPCTNADPNYDVHETKTNTIKNLLATKPGVTKRYYAWAQTAASGTWYQIKSTESDNLWPVKLADLVTTEEKVASVATAPTLLTSPTGNGVMQITGLENGKDYFFRLVVTKNKGQADETVQKSNYIRLTPHASVVRVVHEAKGVTI